ncbi:flagellar hook-length control protein FliK [Janthinobacterium sp. HLX7-2]|uniref:flagellar hook-length control protein FliK n=1 Tax=Janthinobacterium sp. HLX7-2 TaxID=1259331 RepID=UPI003F20E09D
MPTLQNPISQITSPNATPGPANRALPTGNGADGDFQRTLNRQIEQRQASRNSAQAQAPATRPAAAKAPGSEAKPAEPAATQDKQAASASEAAAKDSAPAEDDTPEAATAQPPADPAAEMLALVSNIHLAMQPPSAAGKAAQGLAARSGIKADAKSLAATQLLAGGKVATAAQAEDGDFAASLGHAQGKAAATPAGKLAIDTTLAATVKTGSAVAEPLLKDAPADLSRLAAQLQPGALQQAAAAAAMPADKLAGRVGTPAWDQQLGQKVVWMAAGGDQSATLTLNPPDLGPLQVVLTVTNDQADAAFMSAQPEVRQALEAAMPRLREMMSEAGIAFGNATVSAGTPEQQNNGERAAAGERRGGGQHGGVSGGEIAIAPATGGRSRPTLGAVDTFA